MNLLAEKIILVNPEMLSGFFKDKILRTKVGIYALSPNPKYKLIYSC